MNRVGSILRAAIVRMPRVSKIDALAAGGVAAITAGVSMVFLPAGLIVLGALMLVVVVGSVRLGGTE